MTISLTWPIHSDPGLAQLILKECRSTPQRSSAVSVLRDLQEPTTSDPTSELIPTNDRLSALCVGRRSRDNMTEKDTKAYIRERRNSYAEESSRAVITGAAGDGSQEQTHLEDISEAKPEGFASSRFSTKRP